MYKNGKMTSGRHNECKKPDQPRKKILAFTAQKKFPVPPKSDENEKPPSAETKELKQFMKTKKEQLKGSKLPVPIGRKGPVLNDKSVQKANGVGSINLKDLQITDAPQKAVDASVGVEPKIFVSQGSTGTDIVFNPVKEDEDLYPTHLKLENESTYKFYEDTLAKFRGTDMHDTVREVAKNMIADKVLMKYSYCGQRTKMTFKIYYNVTNVIITSTIESMKRAYRQEHKRDKTETEEEKEKLYAEVKNYFTKEYLKKAKSRFDKTKN